MSILEAPRRRHAACLSDFVLDRLTANDLAGEPGADDVRAHVTSCARCRNRLAEFGAVEAPRFGDVFAESLESRPTHPAKRWTMPAIALAAAAAFVVSVRAKWSDEPPSATRTKGMVSLGVVLRRPSGDVSRPTPGEAVFPGDALRFEITAARPGFVTVLGLDAAGAVAVYAPAAESTIRLEAGMPTILPGSIVADSTLGPERIVAVLCAQAPVLDDLREAAVHALTQARGDPRRVTELGTSCSETSFMIDKRERP